MKKETNNKLKQNKSTPPGKKVERQPCEVYS